ncbi:hypothetical protein K1X12_11135 [Hyphomonas sp. WL0036]|uniref:RNA polymerase sigma factor n=1 Tax=Hyphomonas sediminis TaxID=2866160 RepID=UPI001C7F342F|nr:hypothetical protein [Hyphomonas sediminis]
MSANARGFSRRPFNPCPPAARQILVLSRIEGLSYTDISARTGHSPAFISRSIQRSLKQLSARLHGRERGDQR